MLACLGNAVEYLQKIIFYFSKQQISLKFLIYDSENFSQR